MDTQFFALFELTNEQLAAYPVGGYSKQRIYHGKLLCPIQARVDLRAGEQGSVSDFGIQFPVSPLF
jgi:hypothetical protein